MDSYFLPTSLSAAGGRKSTVCRPRLGLAALDLEQSGLRVPGQLQVPSVARDLAHAAPQVLDQSKLDLVLQGQKAPLNPKAQNPKP